MRPSVTVLIDDVPVPVPAGVTLAAAFLAAGRRALGWRPRGDLGRGIYCGMGICHDCVVTVVGAGEVRACVTEVVDRMRVQTAA